MLEHPQTILFLVRRLRLIHRECSVSEGPLDANAKRQQRSLNAGDRAKAPRAAPRCHAPRKRQPCFDCFVSDGSEGLRKNGDFRLMLFFSTFFRSKKIDDGVQSLATGTRGKLSCCTCITTPRHSHRSLLAHCLLIPPALLA